MNAIRMICRAAAALALLMIAALNGDAFKPRDAAEYAAFHGIAAQHRIMAERWVKIKRSKYGQYWTYAKVNDAKVAALIDTGASNIALSYEDAERAGLNPFRLKFDKRLYTANGVTLGAEVMLRQVVVKNIILRDVEGVVMPKGAMRGTLLGMSFLNRLTSFSFERGVLRLEE